MRKQIFHDLGVYFKLFQNQAKNIADLFSIKWEFDKMGDLSVFLGHKKLKWDPISSGTDCSPTPTLLPDGPIFSTFLTVSA